MGSFSVDICMHGMTYDDIFGLSLIFFFYDKPQFVITQKYIN